MNKNKVNWTNLKIKGTKWAKTKLENRNKFLWNIEVSFTF